eukprot:1278334-Rhodomonas_salina.2
MLLRIGTPQAPSCEFLQNFNAAQNWHPSGSKLCFAGAATVTGSLLLAVSVIVSSVKRRAMIRHGPDRASD